MSRAASTVRSALRDLRYPALGVALFLALWWVGSLCYGPFILPSPLEACRALWRLTLEGAVGKAALVTAGRALGGFAVAAVLGSTVGILAGLHPALARTLRPITAMLLGIPPIAWIVLAMLWFGTTGLTPVFTVVVTALPIVFAVAVEGARTRDRGLEDMGRSFDTPPAMLFLDVRLPHILSYLFPGWVTALGLSWKVAVMAELLASTDGIGADLALARVNLETADVLAWIIVLLAMLLAVDLLLLDPLQRRLEPWRRTVRSS
ncbi:binding-protein-dependent transport systems inner membrane component [Pseudodesulfovibrio mercurii]|uniref:Binding-protein-dependent transport systems inner membrane component n=1 Tax=Pseudodesulfovibrio mercurii TaxID=641491 RepID=F0JCY1_9BACT|nr:ABC transporter permease [Pseudodesulfovibrio mercurii]EGB13309.1 binding-protein-dependent transport systems inner membrane component [Pseudodesulfovibrio mercurii]